MTQPDLDPLKENNIFLVRVTANMAHLMQPPDVAVNRSLAKSFFKRQFTE